MQYFTHLSVCDVKVHWDSSLQYHCCTTNGSSQPGSTHLRTCFGLSGPWCSQRSQCSTQAVMCSVFGQPLKLSQPFLMTSLRDDGADYVVSLLSGRGMSVDSHIVLWMQVDPWEVRGRAALWCHRSACATPKVWVKKKQCEGRPVQRPVCVMTLCVMLWPLPLYADWVNIWDEYYCVHL